MTERTESEAEADMAAAVAVARAAASIDAMVAAFTFSSMTSTCLSTQQWMKDFEFLL